MLQTCFGIYIVLALFTLLIFWGTFVEALRQDEEKKGHDSEERIIVYL